MPLLTIHAPHGPALEFFVVFVVILIGPIVFRRLGLPGLIGLMLGGFVIGSHGLHLIGAGDQLVPELGQIGLLYLMFVAGLELDLRVLRDHRRAAVSFGLIAFLIPGAVGFALGLLLGWSLPAALLLGALLSSHTLIVYPTLRDAGLGGNPAVATAVGATVLTDTLALCVLAIVAGTQTSSGSPAVLVGELVLGLVVLIVVGVVVLPRAVDAFLRRWGDDRVARFVVVIVALLGMAVLAEVFDIEGIVGAFFAGLALNRLFPNEGPSMESVEFFGAAMFIPVFLVSIGLILDPSVMFTGHTLGIAGLLCVASLGGTAIACWLAGPLYKFTRAERAAMYVLSEPQAAATLAVALVGYEIGLFGTAVVNAVLVLILVSIVVSALIAQRVVVWLPARAAKPPLGGSVLVVTLSRGPTDAAMRAATLLMRPDGGRGDVLIARTESEPALDAAGLRAVESRILRHGFDGHVRTAVDSVADAVRREMLSLDSSLVIVDEPTYDASPGPVPVLVVTDGSARLIPATGEADGDAAEIARRLAKGRSQAWRLSGSSA
jgi:Kef-type K+ transport system membrane component KefB